MNKTTQTLTAARIYSIKLQATSSSNEKKQIISQYKDDENICRLLQYVYSPYVHFGVTSSNFKKLNHICDTDDAYEEDDQWPQILVEGVVY